MLLDFVYLNVNILIAGICVQFTAAKAAIPISNMRTTPCPSYKFLKLDKHLVGKCHRCSLCSKGYYATQKCSGTNDTKCELCPGGTYNDVRGGECKTCSICLAGTYRYRTCNGKRDTKCKTCPHRTFTDKQGLSSCKLCTRCRRFEKHLQKCSRLNDTLCGDCKKGYFREFGSGQCLKCSPCKTNETSKFIRQCVDQSKPGSIDICWPSYDRPPVTVTDRIAKLNRTEVTITDWKDNREEEEEEAYTSWKEAAVILACIVCLLVFVFVTKMKTNVRLKLLCLKNLEELKMCLRQIKH